MGLINKEVFLKNCNAEDVVGDSMRLHDEMNDESYNILVTCVKHGNAMK